MKEEKYISVIEEICKVLVDSTLLSQSDFKEVISEAKLILNRLIEMSYTHGYYIPSFAVAIIYIAIRKLGLALTMNDIIQSSNDKRVTMKEATKAYKSIMLALDLPSFPPIDYSGLVDTLVKKIKIMYPFTSFSIVEDDLKVAKKSAKMLIDHAIRRREDGIVVAAGRDPRCVVAAALYKSLLDSGIHLSQLDIARAALITPVSLRNAYHALFMSDKQERDGGRGRGEGDGDREGKRRERREEVKNDGGGDGNGDNNNDTTTPTAAPTTTTPTTLLA